MEQSITEHINLEKAGLQRLPCHTYPEIERFVDMFIGAAMWRRPMLVIVAATNMGKSMLAEHTLVRIAGKLGLPGFVEVTVEGDDSLDFSDYDHRLHSGILLDGVADALLLKTNRETLQGRPKKAKGGRSKTMKFSYPFTLSRRAVIVTMDLSATNLDMFRTDHWLSDPKNVTLLRLSQPCYGSDTYADASVPMDRRTLLSSWSVADVVSFLNAKDLSGPATQLHSSGVNGSDLLDMSREVLQESVRLTPFAARKVMEARDAFLHVGLAP